MKQKIITVLFLLLSSITSFAQIDQGEVIDQINILRSEGCKCANTQLEDVAEVKWNLTLADIAKIYTDHLFETNESNPNKGGHIYLSHIGSDGSTLTDRLKDGEYEAKYISESIAYLNGNEDLTISHWLDNPVECKKIMSKNVTEIGAARTGDFWVLLLAEPKITIKQ